MMDPRPVVLEGRSVRLIPMQAEHAEAFVKVGLGQDLFRWFPFRVETTEEMHNLVRTLLAQQERGESLPFTTVLKETGEVVGSTSFLAIDRSNHRLEIGSTWIASPWQRSPCNTEAKYLQLRHCFEDLGCLRVEFKTDSLNQRSRAALARIGAKEEGTFRNHMICPGHRRRHSVYFSVIEEEWPEVKKDLESKLARPSKLELR